MLREGHQCWCLQETGGWRHGEKSGKADATRHNFPVTGPRLALAPTCDGFAPIDYLHSSTFIPDCRRNSLEKVDITGLINLAIPGFQRKRSRQDPSAIRKARFY